MTRARADLRKRNARERGEVTMRAARRVDRIATVLIGITWIGLWFALGHNATL